MKLPSEPGLYFDVPFDVYRRIDAINQSKLKKMAQSAFHFRAAMLAEDEDTDPMRVGRATHTAVLEPERLAKRWAEWTGKVRNGNEWKRFVAECKESGLEILTSNQLAEVRQIAAAVLSHEQAAKYLRGGRAEVTMIWDHIEPESEDGPGFTIRCKARTDIAALATGVLADLKSCRDASRAGFGKASANLGYLPQAAFYRDGYEVLTGKRLGYRIVAVESSYPYAVQVYRVTEAQLAEGREVYRGWLAKLARCRAENRWDGYAAEEMDLELPSWATPANEDEDASTWGIVFGSKEEAI